MYSCVDEDEGVGSVDVLEELDLVRRSRRRLDELQQALGGVEEDVGKGR